jgi:2',3'-cyclic-nucleotide 2'-phosphodiesterase (5'-nucleotidase family)
MTRLHVTRAAALLALLVPAAFAADPPPAPRDPPVPRGSAVETLNLILPAAIHGEMIPCGHCATLAGGLGRLAGLIQACKDTADHVLVADGGDLLPAGDPDPQVERFLIDVMTRQIGCTVFSVGEFELARGEKYLRDLTAGHPGVDWIAANIVDRVSRKPRFSPYAIRRAGQVTIGFTSVIDPDFAPQGLDPGTEIAVPEPALQDVLDQMRSECQYVVCFVHTRMKTLSRVLGAVTGVDIAVSSHDKRIENYPTIIGNARHVFFGGPDGRFANWANVVLEPGKEPYMQAGRTLRLGDVAPEDSTVANAVRAFLGTDAPADPVVPAADDGSGAAGGAVEH